MLLLGIHCMGHDTAAAIVQDGRLVYAVQEERKSRICHDGSFPSGAIAAALKYVRCTADDLDAVCLSFDPAIFIREKYLAYNLEHFPHTQDLLLQQVNHLQKCAAMETTVREQLNYAGTVYCCRHHDAHMASAYYASGYPSAALYSIDGIGEMACSALGLAKGSELSFFEEDTIDFPHSLGLLYSGITDHIGFRDHSDEGKVMGLAPYGDRNRYRELFEAVVQLRDKGRYQLDTDYLAFHHDRHQWFSGKMLEQIGPKRNKGEKLEQHHIDLAAALQAITEKAMLHTAAYLQEKTGEHRLCMAGGVALNCVANGLIRRSTPFRQVFVQPAANDAGCAAGAALYYHYRHRSGQKTVPMPNAYLGDEYSDAEIMDLLREHHITCRVHDNIYEEVAAALADKKIVGWFNGRSEFGPRSLGNRSILAAPFPADMKDILNSKVKHREGFRPFAPAVCKEDAATYFELEDETPYMTIAAQVKSDHQERLPAVTHVDGSARVQTVCAQQNPAFHRLISTFREHTDIGVLINTSFNVMGQPIVDTPAEALDCFLNTHMDYLVLNARILVTKEALA